MKNKTIVSSLNFYHLCRQLSNLLWKKGVREIYGVPKNGMIIELMLCKFNPFDVVSKENITKDTWIIDDLIDSGKTLSEFPNNKKAVLFVKNPAKNLDKIDEYLEVAENWVQFHFEKENERADMITRLIESFGEDITREGLQKTPVRSSKAWDKILEGYSKNPMDIITSFENESNDIDQIVGLSNIEFYSTCEHHLLPFTGVAHIYYIPNKKIVGISKLARVLDVFARRLQNQERITKQVADFFEKELGAKAVAVVLEGKHLCMMARGVEKQMATMKTSDIRGLFKTDNQARTELFQLIK